MKCDLCFKRGKDLNPHYIYGETYHICEECYTDQCEKGVL